MFPLKPAFLIIFLLSAVPVHADTFKALSSLKKQAEDKQLWLEKEWLDLVHYQHNGSSYESQVDDKNFFYAKQGKTDPRAELLATLDALYTTTELDDAQAQCRFVARSNWLEKQLSIHTDTLPLVHCKEYRQWREHAHGDTVTLIFPAYNLSSPSSMFGHTLLRLDTSDNSSSEWLSLAVNFGANINNTDNSLVYAFRGLAGGYPGTFVIQPYYKKIQEYNRIEQRDIWEYSLNLNAEETERMITHLWELKNVNFDYYFFDENCSYRLLELLEVARPSLELTDEFVVTAIPVDTVKSIEKAGLIKNKRYRPSQVTQLKALITNIPSEHRHFIDELMIDTTIASSKEFTALTLSQQQTITDAAYKLFRYNHGSNREPASAKQSFQLLKQLNSFPVNKAIHIEAPTSPEAGHGSKRLTLSPGKRLGNNYLELGFKMAFHDLEDNKEGFLQGAQINIGSIKVRAEDNVGLRLYQLDLVDIFSLTPRDDYLSPLSWKIYTGFERQLTNNRDQLSYHVTGGAGGSWTPVKNHQLYALGIARLEINKQLKNTLEPAIGFNSGLLSHFKHTTAHLEISGEQFEDNIYRLRAQYTQNFVLSTEQSIKLFLKHQWQNDNVEFSDVNLSYQYYF